MDLRLTSSTGRCTEFKKNFFICLLSTKIPDMVGVGGLAHSTLDLFRIIFTPFRQKTEQYLD